jgi:hypothetical protein
MNPPRANELRAQAAELRELLARSADKKNRLALLWLARSFDLLAAFAERSEGSRADSQGPAERPGGRQERRQGQDKRPRG